MSPVKLLAGKVLTSRPVGRAIRTVTSERVRHFGEEFDTAGLSSQTVACLFWQSYESAEVRLVRRHFVATTNVVDLGAGIGVTARHVRAVMSARGSLTVVEANPQLIPVLHRNAPDAAIVNAAIDYSHTGNVSTLSIGDEHIDSKLSVSSDSIAVPRITLRDVIPPGPYQLISDVEGAEAGLILEGGRHLDECTLALFELHEGEYRGVHVTVDDLVTGLVSLGFAVAERRGVVVVVRR